MCLAGVRSANSSAPQLFGKNFTSAKCMLPGRSTSELVRHFYDTFKHSTSYRAFRSLEEQGLLVRAALPALSRVVRPRAATASSGG